MKRFSLSSLLVLGVMASGMFWIACGPKPPPGPTPEELAARAREQARQDSIRAAEEAARLAREAEARRAAEEAARLVREAEERRRAEEAARRVAEEEARRRAMLNTVYFDFDKFNIRDDEKAALDENARRLRDYRPEDQVLIEGHCDERGTVEYNLALGDRRANRVKRYLVSAGIDAGRLDTISYGEERPAVMGSDERSWARNRRAELKRQQ
jgi:peptidoglycan-associated lipoprotein